MVLRGVLALHHLLPAQGMRVAHGPAVALVEHKPLF